MNGYTNGTAHAVPVRSTTYERRDPLAHVLGIGADMTWVAVVAVVGAILIHGAAGTRAALIDPVLLKWAGQTGHQIEGRLQQSIDISTVKDKEPPPPPVDEPKDEQPEEKVVTKPVEQNPYENVEQKQQEQPTTAQAGQILAANDDMLDFTGDKFVTGKAESYAGGKTTTDGKKKTEEKVGGQGGGGTDQTQQPAVQGPDRSRSVSLAGGTDWKCPWPAEADAEQMDEAKVELEVFVDVNGRATKVDIKTDPGFGFAREARSCALRQSYNTALDREGKAIASSKKFKVRFER